MIERFEYKGVWWLPGIGKQISGTLTYVPQEKLILELIGSFEGLYRNTRKDVILGTTDEGDITLTNNRYRGARTRSNGITIESFVPQVVFKGYHLETLDELNFERVHFIGFNLFSWLDISGLNKKMVNDDNSFNIEYSNPEDIAFELNDGCSGTIKIISSLNRKREYNHLELSEQCTVTLDYGNSKEFHGILEDITAFIGFISLFTFEQSYPMEIKVCDPSIRSNLRKKEYRKVIDVIYNHFFYDPKYRVVHPQECLVKYQDIKDDFPSIIKLWFENYFCLKPEHILILGYFRDKNKFSEGMFLDFVRAVESYHRNVYKKKRLPDPEYDSMVTRILKKADWCENEIKFLRSRLKKNTNLKDRIKYLISEYNNHYVGSKFADAIVIKDIINSRNYYSHLNKEDESKALKGRDLFVLTQKIIGLLFSCMLTDIGVDKSLFQNRLTDQLYE